MLPASMMSKTLVILAGLAAWQGGPQASAQMSANAMLWVRLPPVVLKIGRLADRDFRVRQAAAEQLLCEGVEAWDWLVCARNSGDPEIARAAVRLLGQIPFEQELEKHAPCLAGWRLSNVPDRVRMIIYLGRQHDRPAQTALALLSRFEVDEYLSRMAAIELITGPRAPIPDLAAVVRTSPRRASDWLRIHAETAGRFQAFAKRWHPVMQVLMEDPWAESRPAATRRLLRWYAEQLLVRGETERVRWAAEQMVWRLEPEPAAWIETFDWLLHYRQWQVCDQLVSGIPESLQDDVRLLYRRAELARQQGRMQEADDIVVSLKQASSGDDSLVRLQTAVHLQLAGLDYWAGKAMQTVVDDPATPASVRIQAGTLLAELQFGEGDFQAAAATLQAAVGNQQQSGSGEVVLLHGDLTARLHLFCHLAALDREDPDEAQTHLLDGLASDPQNSDLLVAMLRFSRADWSDGEQHRWRQTASELIQLALQQRLQQIEELRTAWDKDARQSRARNESLVAELNAWAWLASRSGTNLEQAESLAREAVAMSPGNGLVLDTLAACLFARAKLDEAVTCQQRAFRQAPWSRQVRSGLEKYRQAVMLAEMQGLFR
jgi:tetratricopeptide (TPR) repeat protein